MDLFGHTRINPLYEVVQSAETKERKDRAVKRLDYYNGEQVDYLNDEIARTFQKPEKVKPLVVNIVKKVVDNLATAYISPPKREVEGTDRDKELFEHIAENSMLSIKMQDASRLTKLLKTAMIRPVWSNGKIRLDILTPDMLDVVTGDAPEDLEKVIVTHDPTGYTKDVRRRIWTPDEVVTTDHHFSILEREVNPYGVLPFVPLWDALPIGSSFWVKADGNLLNAQDRLNDLWTKLLLMIDYQGFGIFVMKGGKLNGGLSGMEVVPVDENGDLKVVNPSPLVLETIEAIKELQRQVAVNYGLSAAIMSTDSKAESGVAKLEDNRELLTKRDREIALFRGYEKRLFDLIKIVWNTNNPTQSFSDSAELAVDFAEVKKSLSESERREIWERDLELGIKDRADILMEANPDFTDREEAKAYLMERRRFNGEYVNDIEQNYPDMEEENEL
ncbi:hypothetical protein [Pseudodesulfovibrio senegalensis]|uniref:Phage portal protein n=1 Tax=Pseudodesulfovibrio senegalensis TaxID=1721087 RepID=A0A6N6N4C5_9BACT|nr:hypothetical protein [Pseudodesulfovibrio senegalensis]KAB1443080.1 hypothetical protein F8A88_02105 [Pseudodesulfovibrio senegalensis]